MLRDVKAGTAAPADDTYWNHARFAEKSKANRGRLVCEPWLVVKSRSPMPWGTDTRCQTLTDVWSDTSCRVTPIDSGLGAAGGWSGSVGCLVAAPEKQGGAYPRAPLRFIILARSGGAFRCTECVQRQAWDPDDESAGHRRRRRPGSRPCLI